jgi:hypothetical protein
MAARCCWCNAPLTRWVAQPGITERPFVCPSLPCQERIYKFSVVLKQKGRPPRPLWIPLPKQVVWSEAALNKRVTRLLVGGAAGPGKSKWLREMLYRFAQLIPGFHGLLLRRTFPDLSQSHIRFIPGEVALRGGTWKIADRVIEFPHKDQATSLIRCGHLEDHSAMSDYLSAEYDVIAPDEMVTFDCESMIELFTRARSSNPHLMKIRGGYQYEDYNEDGILEHMTTDGSLVIASSNPGGKGARWVKEFFVDKNPDPDTYPNYRPEFWHFEGARLRDNPYLARGYVATLRDLPETRRRQLMDGDWDAFSGAFFNFRQSQHVADLGIHP